MSDAALRRIYNPKHAVVGEPVPFRRQKEIADETSDRWWSFYSSAEASRRDPYKIFDADAVLDDIARTLDALARLEAAVGEEKVRAWIQAALDKHCPKNEGDPG